MGTIIGISTLIVNFLTFGLLCWTLYYAHKQFEEASKQRNLQTTMEVTKLIADENFMDSDGELLRHQVCQMDVPITHDEYKKSDTSRKNRLLLLLMTHDRVATLIKLGLVDERVFYDWQKFEVAKIWENMKYVVNLVREDPLTKKGQKNFCHNLEWLATEWLERMNQGK
jgi:hypothetical protein